MKRLWDRMRRGRFVVLGRVGMDLYADPPGTPIETATRYMSAIGGSAGNIAVALARQGVRAALLSCVSDDAVGRYCRAELDRYGVDTTHLRATTGEARTSLAVAETRPVGCQTVLYRNGAADFALTEADVAAVDYGPVAALVVTGTALAKDPSREAVRQAMRLARDAGALVVLDVDHRAYSWTGDAEAARVCLDAARMADVVVGNVEEFALMAGSGDGMALARSLVQERALVAVYKQGAEGSQTFTPDYRFASPAFAVEAKKPMGAGDGFMGGFLAGLAQGATLEGAVRRGAATAAIIVSGIGCAPASPDLATLETFLERA